jgi:hypothetical protein
MVDYQVGDRIRYTRGAQWTVRGHVGIVRRVYAAHGQTMLDVDFGSVTYPCWVENVEPAPDEIPIHISSFPPEEASTTKGGRPK